MQLFLAADHGGFNLKSELMARLADLSPVDLGAFTHDSSDDYPQFAFELAKQVVQYPTARGVLICRSGIGMSIAANKVKGAYAALCHTVAQAAKAREHNDANILVLDADYEHDDHEQVIRTFLSTPFAGERHERRVAQIKSYEASQSI